jgi:hypothetical protein
VLEAQAVHAEPPDAAAYLPAAHKMQADEAAAEVEVPQTLPRSA